jgi:hypothetical protein
VKACLFLILGFLFASGAGAAERLEDSSLSATPEQATSGRKPASAPSPQDAAARNRALFFRLKAGDSVIIMNSLPGWEDQVAKVTEKYEDGSVRIRLQNGKTGSVKATVLADTLAPETVSGCGTSHGVEICKGDNVFYPARSTSLEIPEAPISHVFENQTLTVSNGAEFVLDWKQVGKPVQCSPQKENICVGDHVHADGYKKGQPVTFEGDVEKAYSHGVILVRTDSLWRFPIDVTAVKKRIAVIAEPGPEVVTERALPKRLPADVKVSPEIEPLDLHKADQVDQAR